MTRKKKRQTAQGKQQGEDRKKEREMMVREKCVLS